MKTLTLLLATFLLFSCTQTEEIKGDWTGRLKMNGKTVDIIVHFDGTNSSFSSQELMMLDIPLTELEFKNNIVTFNINPGNEIPFSCVLKKNKILGSGLPNGAPRELLMNIELTEAKESTIDKPYTIESIDIQSNGITLSAKVYQPKAKQKHPAIVLLHGSSTNLKEQYAFDADFYARQGFEVLVFDKRGNGESTGDYNRASYDDLVADAIVCLETMKTRETVDPNKIGLWGFSQGALLLPYIATKTDIPSFLIAKSPEVRKVSDAAAYQDSLRLVNMGYTVENAQYAAHAHRQVEQLLLEGCSKEDLINYINTNAEGHDFMNNTGLPGNISISNDAFDSYYWKGRTYDAYPYWKRLNTKTLILTGEDDEFVNAIKNEECIQKMGNESIEVKLFPRADHSLRKSINPRKYPDIDFPRVAEGYSDFIEQWLRQEIIAID